MKALKEYIFNLLVLGLMIFSYGMALISSSRFEDRNEIYMLYQKDHDLTAAGALEMQKTEHEQDVPILFAAWGNQENTEIKNADLEKTALADAIVLCGSSDLLLAAEGYLGLEDYDGCLISADTAAKLFGSTDVAGKSIELDKRKLFIRGILKDAKGSVLYQADSKTETALDAIAVQIPENKTGSSVMQLFTERHGLDGRQTAMRTFGSFAALAAMALPLMMGCFICIPVFRAAYRCRGSLLLSGSLLIVLILYITLYFRINEFRLMIPADFIPTKWSEFSFWGKLLNSKREEYTALFQMEIRAPERFFYESFLDSLRYSLVCCGLYLVFIRRIKITSMMQYYGLCLYSLLISFICIFINKNSAGLLASKKSFWLFMVIYLAGVFMVDKIKLYVPLNGEIDVIDIE